MLIDVHAHIGRIVKQRKEALDGTHLICKMDEWGIDRACVLGLSETPEAEYQDSDTEDVLRECSRFPGRLIPFCLIDPRFGRNDPSMDFSYLLEEYVARGCRGMGEMLPKLAFDDPRCLNLFRQAGRFGMPIIFDMNDNPIYYGLRDDPGLPRLEKALRECPGTVLVGHGPTFWAEISGDVPPDQRVGYPSGPVRPGGAVSRLMAQYSNLWADLSAGSGYNAISRDPGFGLEFLDQFQDRLMFGTDYCIRSQKTVANVGFFQSLRAERRLSDDAWEKIAWKNAARLLKQEIRQ
ncbi:MAG: amidohydrolase family protein [Armatimonadetes bacterium]|nr:amidohydrolase family protein [Armatimonadota bacterium]